MNYLRCMNLRRINEPEKKISKELFFFINKCLQKDPEKRANVYELRNGDFLNYDANSSDKMGEAVLRNFLKGIVEEDLKGNFILNINKDYEEEIKIRDLNKMWSNSDNKKNVSGVVVSVPDYFTLYQRKIMLNILEYIKCFASANQLMMMI